MSMVPPPHNLSHQSLQQPQPPAFLKSLRNNLLQYQFPNPGEVHPTLPDEIDADSSLEGRTEGRKEGRKDGWMDGWMEVYKGDCAAFGTHDLTCQALTSRGGRSCPRGPQCPESPISLSLNEGIS